MFSTASEMQVQRDATVAFISTDPITVTLIPRTQTVENGVRKSVVGAPRVPQVMKLIMQSPAGGSIEQHAAQGTARLMEFTLLGVYDSVGDIGDYWEDGDGTHWEVTAVIPDNGYERRFTVEANGRHATGG